MMKVLVCGDRNWSDYNLIYKALKDVSAVTIIEGGARGADTMAGHAAVELGMTVANGRLKVYPAQWHDSQGRYRRWAGPERNKFQYDVEQPDLVLAFHDNLDNSKGTAHMVRYATSQGCKVIVYDQWMGNYTIEGKQ